MVNETYYIKVYEKIANDPKIMEQIKRALVRNGNGTQEQVDNAVIVTYNDESVDTIGGVTQRPE